MPDVMEDQTTSDMREVWALGLNIGPDPDLDAIADPAARRVLSQCREDRLSAYTWFLLQHFHADADRLAAAAAGCRARYDEVAAGPGDHRLAGYTGGAVLAGAALQIIRDAGADTDPAARNRLLEEIERRFDPDIEPYRQGLWHRHSWPRRALRRLNLHWWVRQLRAARSVQLDHRFSGRSGIEQIDIWLDGVEVGRLKYQVCGECWQGRVGKLSIDDDRQGRGLGTRALKAAIARTPGYSWHTTPQYDTARTYWRRAGLSDHHPAPCPHMDGK